MGLAIGIALGAGLLLGLGYLIYQGGKAERDIARAKAQAVRRKATVRSFHAVESPKTSAVSQSMGMDRRQVFLSVHISEDEEYAASPIWRFVVGNDLAEGQAIDVLVHKDKPWIVWPTIRHTEYWLGDLASVFYRGTPPE